MYKALARFALVSVAVAGCSGAPAASPSPTSAPVPPASHSGPRVLLTGVATDAGFMPVFMPDEITVAPGDVTFLLENVPGPQEPSPPAHNFVLSDRPPAFSGGDWSVPPVLFTSSTIGPGGWELLPVANLTAGEYTFWCTVRGHFTSGMIGTLTVAP